MIVFFLSQWTNNNLFDVRLQSESGHSNWQEIRGEEGAVNKHPVASYEKVKNR